MDIAMLLGGTVVTMLQGLGPAERHIFQTIAEDEEDPVPVIRRPFAVIEGGAA